MPIDLGQFKKKKEEAPKTLTPPKSKKIPEGPPKRIQVKKDDEIPKNIEDKLRDLVQNEFFKLLSENFNVSKIDIDKEMNTSDYIREKYHKITNKTWRGTNKGCEIELKKYHVIKEPNFDKVIAEMKKELYEEMKKVLVPSDNNNLKPSQTNNNK